MPHLVENLADLTALRDRDALDRALVGALSEALPSHKVGIFRVVGELGNERWRMSAQLHAGQGSTTGDSAWSSLDALPLLATFAQRQQVLATQQMQHCSSAGLWISDFPLGGALSNVGVLELETTAALTTEDQRLVSGILRLYLNFSNLLDYGERDALTELLNRKTFDGAFLKATLEQRASDSEQSGSDAQTDRRHGHPDASYWLAMIDIDHFKRVNDNYGHLIGDEVLLLLARLMRTHFRFHDQLYRFGGEEFVVLMRCHGEAEAACVLERLRAITQQHAFPQVGAITISIGFSEVKAGDSPSSAFERADKAVYYSKAHGRNQVCSYAALVSSGELADQATNVGEVELF